MSKKDVKFVFFGTSEFAVDVLEVLKTHGLTPSLTVTRADKPQGRGLELTPPPAKTWAEIHRIPVFQPMSLKDAESLERLRREKADVFIVAAYGLLIPKEIFDLPPRKTLNIHPSLLPKLRGPSPIQSAILEEEETGTTIMLINEDMDEGDIIAQEKLDVTEWPPRAEILEGLLARRSGELLIKILSDWIEDKITPTPQDDSLVTYSKKIEKEDGLINFNDNAETNLRKVRALAHRPGTYTIYKRSDGREIRVVIKDAEIKDGNFSPTRVIPEGKKEMDWQDFLRGNH